MEKSIRLLLLVSLFAVCVLAQGTFVYTNNDRIPNSISAFSAAANGALSTVPGSPFLTGGNGAGGGFFASNRITTAVVKNFLYCANSGSNTVSAFSINPATGFLAAVPGSPFATGGVADGVGMSLTATPDDKFLIAANGASMTITVFSVAANGALSQVPGSPFPSGAAGPLASAKVTSDAKFLAVTSAPGNVSVFSIAPAGGLLLTPSSPFPDPGSAGIDCNCASTRLDVALNGAASAKLDVLNISPLSGVLSRIPGSPFTGPGFNSNVAVLSPDDSKLFVSNQSNNTVTVFSVAADGSLTVVPGSPFPVSGAIAPSGMATNQAGTLLYVADVNNLISGFSVAANGALTPVPGSPFSNGFPGFSLLSLTVFPAKNCCPAAVISAASATPDILRPPNHKLVDVTINYSVTEPCPHSCTLTVASDEPVNGASDGNTSPDWQVIDTHHVLLRAERAGNAADRVYTITITCANNLNQLSSTKVVTVSVPHDQGN